jgi:predicted CXXCH cytochrome family protein
MSHFGSLLCLFIALILFTQLARSQAPADVWSTGGQHPVSIKADANCSECHSTLSQGKYVHTAMSMGCTTCHTVTQKAGATSVALTAPVNQICLTCHSLSSDKLQHLPYKLGDCIICHSPHSSDFPQHTWVAHQDLCLGCHTHERLKVDRHTHAGLLPWGITVDAELTEQIPALDLTDRLTKNHPIWGHPVSGPNKALGKDAPPVSCLSCHEPHASNFQSLLVIKPNPGNFACNDCLLCMKCHRPSDVGYQLREQGSK